MSQFSLVTLAPTQQAVDQSSSEQVDLLAGILEKIGRKFVQIRSVVAQLTECFGPFLVAFAYHDAVNVDAILCELLCRVEDDEVSRPARKVAQMLRDSNVAITAAGLFNID